MCQEVLAHPTTQMNFEDIILREMSLPKKTDTGWFQVYKVFEGVKITESENKMVRAGEEQTGGTV
jgi:hypothetical protein